MSRTTEAIGRCGEHLTAASLCLFGSDLVSIIPHGSHADIVFEYNNIVYRVQVKTKTKQRLYKKEGKFKRVGWNFDLRRGKHTKDRNYGAEGLNEIDMYALVCLPYNNIKFVPFSKKKKLTVPDEEMKNINSLQSLKSTIQALRQN
tara:strand:- start:10552 stop:10989 length:438 start_codon:yes stop_codon:yes gene_type:complete